uniref:Uncharacterized protein n=1 Tax=Cannabis sativa TaxID=3483 RepID=A0A803PGA6_CANSA
MKEFHELDFLGTNLRYHYWATSAKVVGKILHRTSPFTACSPNKHGSMPETVVNCLLLGSHNFHLLIHPFLELAFLLLESQIYNCSGILLIVVKSVVSCTPGVNPATGVVTPSPID